MKNKVQPVSEDKKWMKKEKRKESIIETAVNIFLEKGVSHTTMKDIAEKEGISEPAVYRYFDNKHAIFQTIIEKGIELINSLWEQFEMKLDQLTETPRESLYKLSKSFWDIALKYRPIIVVLAKEFHDPSLKPIFEKISKERKGATVLTEFFETCQKKGNIRSDISPETLAYLFLSASRPALGAIGYLESEFSQSSINIKRNIKEFLKVFFEGIKIQK